MKQSISPSPLWMSLLGASLVTIGAAPYAQAANSWASWWLPPNYSRHGDQVDSLFNWIFWITMIAMILVFLAMGIFLIKYRHREGAKKGTYIHGNTRLEMVWTIVPAIILALIALASKSVWTEYRYAADYRDPNVKPAKIMVIGEQFKWNVIYPGPDGKFGKYLLFPKQTDAKWPDGQKFQGFASPRDVPMDKWPSVVKNYLGSGDAARLGKDMNDPDGKDDDYTGSLGRIMEVPVDRPTDIYVGSKDVIHSFSLPNFRLKLDTVPGLLNIVSFTPKTTDCLASKREADGRKLYKLDEIQAVVSDLATRDQRISISQADADRDNKPDHIVVEKEPTGAWRFFSTDSKGKKSTIIRDGQSINFDPSSPDSGTIAQLKKTGVSEITCYTPGYFDIVCQELCGQGHFTMQGQLYVIDGAEFVKKYETVKTAAALTTQPTLTVAQGASGSH